MHFYFSFSCNHGYFSKFCPCFPLVFLWWEIALITVLQFRWWFILLRDWIYGQSFGGNHIFFVTRWRQLNFCGQNFVSKHEAISFIAVTVKGLTQVVQSFAIQMKCDASDHNLHFHLDNIQIIYQFHALMPFWQKLIFGIEVWWITILEKLIEMDLKGTKNLTGTKKCGL